MVCVLPQGHSPAGRETIALHNLEGDNLITLLNFDHCRLAVERALEDQRISPSLRVDAFTARPACQPVLNGAGIAIVDALTAFDHAGEDVRIRRFEKARIKKAASFEIFPLEPKYWMPSMQAGRFAAAAVTNCVRETRATVSARFDRVAT